MNIHMIESERAEKRIAESFLEILATKPAGEITITEIVQKANVSRMAYYRHFNSKENIVEFFLEEIVQSEMSCDADGCLDLWSQTHCKEFFVVMLKYSKRILMLLERGYAGLIFDFINQKNIQFAGNMSVSSIDRYDLYYMSGASFAGAIMWLRYGKESVDEISSSFANAMSAMREKHSTEEPKQQFLLSP